MEPDDLGRVIGEIDRHFGLTDDCEITLEANPDTLTKERLQRFREIGINRLSLGMQSAVPHVLSALDRTHNPDNLPKVVQWAHEVGFTEISIDLIYGAPGRASMSWRTTMQIQHWHSTSHIYRLTR
jgi:oxygen-independent coproporphyrinogen-3 oxidase